MEKGLLKSKFFGSLIGTAVGDALGARLEGRRVEERDILELVEIKALLRYTDDTHMMIGVAESLIQCRGFDGAHMALTFLRNYEREPFRGYGPGPPRIFRLIKNGVAWDEAADRFYPGGSYGNGSAMRIAPIGVFYSDNITQLKEIAYKSSQITHSHPLGKEGAALQAYAIALATNSDLTSELDRDDFLRKLQEFVEQPIYKEKVKKIGELLEERNKLKVVKELGNGIEAFNSVPTAIYSFLTHPNSFEEAVLYSISLGGDTDTIGAMTGALSGARLGIEKIPERWLNKLENKGYIEGLAERLWIIKTQILEYIE